MFVLSLYPVWNFWWIEKSLMRRFAALLILVCVVIAFGFLAWPSHIQAPLVVSGVPGIANHKPGTDIHGIKWQSYYSELQITFTNPTEDDYQNFDMSVLVPNLVMMHVVQSTNIPNFWVGEETMFGARSPNKVIGSINTPQRIRVETLPRRQRLQILIALAAPSSNLAGVDLSRILGQGIIVEFPGGGPLDMSVLFGPKRLIGSVRFHFQFLN